ncbi:MAG: 50S ribosomal protein L13 [Nitrospinaceae bacterium]
MRTTYIAKKSEVEKNWVLIDATGQPVGRIASKAAAIIRGKTKPTFTPHVDTGDNVIIVNAAAVKLTGKKWLQKTYYRHTGFPGGLKSLRAEELLARRPSDLIKKAINGMLPKTRLGRALRANYRVYDTAEHPHTSQKPEVVTL